MSGDRKIGENFDAKEAEDIFEKLRNVEGKTKSKTDSKFKKIADLMNEANYLKDKGEFGEAIQLYKQVIFTLPDSQKAYEALADIYRKQGDVGQEKEILMKAISGCKNNEGFKKRLNEIN